jgi:hypothetical protein
MNRKQRRAEKKQRGPAMQGASPGVQEVFADALRHHQAGRLNEGERLYRQVLAVDSHHADSLCRGFTGEIETVKIVNLDFKIIS